MGTIETEIKAVIATTVEYAEARALITEKIDVHAQMADLSSKIKYLSKLSPTAVRLAKSDVRQTTTGVLDKLPQSRGPKNKVNCNLVDACPPFHLESSPVPPQELMSAKLPVQDRTPELALFLATVEEKVAWDKLEAIIAPLYPNEAWGASCISLSSMIRLYFLNQWCGLADEKLAQSIDNCSAISTFSGIRQNNRDLPSPAILLRFRTLLEYARLVEEVTTVVLEGLTREGHVVLVAVEH